VLQVASELGVPLVDYEAMSAGLGASEYLQDGHHPSDRFLLEALNLFLNTYEQRRRCGTLPLGGPYAEAGQRLTEGEEGPAQEVGAGGGGEAGQQRLKS
jgi:hypothetical protein